MLRIARTHVGLDRKIGRGSGAMVICLTALLGACRERATPTPQTGASAPIVAKVDRRYGKLQMSFEPNRGQTDARVSFLSRGGGYSLFLEPTEAVFALRKRSGATAATAGVGRAIPAVRDHEARFKAHSGGETSVLGMRLVGANPAAAVVGEAPLPGKVNYYIGNDPKRWLENVPTFGKVRYSRVYPGVDLVYYGTEGRLEYDFVVAPGADPRSIRVAFDGAVPKLTADGEIVLSRGDAEVRLRNLIVYQEQGGVREPVSGRFVLAGDHQVRFAVADYDRTRALVIDPTVVYATYLAGSAGHDEIYGLAVDSTGSAVAVGATTSTDFPVTSGAYQTTNPYPGFDGAAFVTKLSPDGSSLVFSTYLGGHLPGEGDSSSDAFGVAVDPQNNIYVGGSTLTLGFPTTAGVVQPQIGGYAGFKQFGGSQRDGFVTKLTPTGTLAYSTYLGGAGLDYVIAIAVDSAGDAYVTGNTESQLSSDDRGNPVPTPRFPTTSNAYQRPFASPIDPGTGNRVAAGDLEPFFAELDPTGSTLLYSTLLAPETCVDLCSDGSACLAQETCATGAGSCGVYCGGKDYSTSLAIGKGGIAYIGGYINNPNFPTTAGALQTVAHPRLANGSSTGFIAAFDPTKSGASSLVYSTFLGGKKFPQGEGIAGIAADPDGNVYATGPTNSPDFPTTPGAYTTACTADPTATGCGGAKFVTKLDPTGSKLLYSTFITGDGADSYQIALDSARNAYVLGPGATHFIDPLSTTGGMGIQTLSADGSKLLFSTRFNSELNNPSSNYGAGHNGFVVDKAGSIYVASTNANADLPATTGAFQTTPGLDGSGRPTGDGYVVKISPIGASVPPPDGGVGGVGGASASGGAGGNLAGGGGSNGAGGAAGGAPGGKAGASGATGGLGGASAVGGAAGKAGASGATGGKGAPGDAGVYKPGAGGGGSGGGCSVLPSTFPTSGASLMGLLLLAVRRRRKSRRDFGRWER